MVREVMASHDRRPPNIAATGSRSTASPSMTLNTRARGCSRQQAKVPIGGFDDDREGHQLGQMV
jgi:hypothetical protein